MTYANNKTTKIASQGDMLLVFISKKVKSPSPTHSIPNNIKHVRLGRNKEP